MLLEPVEVELEEWQPRVPSESRELRVVLVEVLEQRLQTHSALDVLTELATNDHNLLTLVSTAKERCALVSYRQERGTSNSAARPSTCFDCATKPDKHQADSFSNFTLDGDAFQSVVASAKAHGIKGLWLDCWCYRFVGDYDHMDFCRTLHEVINGVDAVVWLPRSKADSLGEYPYRLWCTFEASCVQQRELEVIVAGVGLSHFQRRILRFGSFTPALRADGTLNVPT
jgi:hypothetical protein